MKKNYFLIFLLSMIILLSFTGCKKENELEIYVSLRNTTTDGIPTLKWIVENRSKTSTVIFKAGDILNYKIRNTNSGKIVTNDEKETNDITLAPDESYETTLEFKDMPIGHYIATFWAGWNDDKKVV